MEKKADNRLEKKLERDYREAWSNPQRMAEFKKWEKLALTSWRERVK